MATSRRWKQLDKQVGLLRQQFLPDPFDPLGAYPQPARVVAATRAFLVLSHAEVESYVEDWAKDVAQASERIWTASQRITEPLAFLLACSPERLATPDDLSKPMAKDQLLTAATQAVYPKFYKRIKDNHGVKEKNLLSLLSPLGVPASAMSSTLLPNLESFGELRGEIAHKSVKAVTNMLDPETEYKRVRNLLADLNTLDQWLIEYRRRIR